MAGSTFNRIRDVFYSGSYAFTGSSEPIQEIAFLVDEGYLTLHTAVIAAREAYTRTLAEITVGQRDAYDASGGCAEHVALKVLAAQFLKAQRNVASHYEHPFCGYTPDVLSYDQRVVVECGHTHNAEKMLTYFQQGAIVECIQIPYPSEGDAHVLGYRFVPDSELTSFLSALEDRKRANAKTAFQKMQSGYD